MKTAKLALAALALASAQMANATILTVSSTGTTSAGVDNLGLFGTAGSSLAGLPFTITVSFDMDSTAVYASDPVLYSRVYSLVPYDVELTVDGHDYAFSVSNGAYSNVVIDNAYSTNHGATDGIQAVNGGTDAFGRAVYIKQQMNDYGIKSSSLTQYLQDTTGFNTYSGIGIGSGPSSQRTYFSSDGQITYTINGEPAHVAPDEPPTPAPEPASVATLGAGLGLIAVVRRRRRTMTVRI